MVGYGAAEQLPVLCKVCGGRAVVQAVDSGVRCPFCGAVDRLPPDELGRALELKARLARAAANVVQLEGTGRALAHIFEDRGAFFRATSSFLAVTAFALVYSVLSAAPRMVDDPRAIVLVLLYNVLPILTFVGGFTLAIVLSLALGRRRYRREVRPLLLALPPRAPGAPMRCRGCGADLPGLGPNATAGLLACPYCGTQSLLTADLHRESARLLAEEDARYRARASGIAAGTTRAAFSMSRTLVIATVLVYVGQIALFAILQLLVPQIL